MRTIGEREREREKSTFIILGTCPVSTKTRKKTESGQNQKYIQREREGETIFLAADYILFATLKSIHYPTKVSKSA